MMLIVNKIEIKSLQSAIEYTDNVINQDLCADGDLSYLDWIDDFLAIIGIGGSVY
jgi:hypothetical protein